VAEGEGAPSNGVGEHADEVPAEALAPELPADIVTPDGVELPESEPGVAAAPEAEAGPDAEAEAAERTYEPGPGESTTDGVLASPDPDNFDENSTDGSIS
jgi:hypothetical protein